MSNQLDNFKKLSVFGNELNYYRNGEGETVLLIHGITTYSFIWRNIWPLLEKKYDVIAVDLFGCGESDKPLEIQFSLKHHSEILKEFIDKLGIKKLHIVGHDVGGGIAQIFVVNYKSLVNTLTLVNTVAYDFWPVQPIIAMRTPIIRQLVMASLDLGTFRLVVKRGVYHKNRVTDELMSLFWQPMRTKQGRKAFLHFAKCLNNQDLLDIEKDLREFQLPTMIIRGDADVYLSSAIAEKLQSEIPNCQLIRISTGGHFIQEDEPEKLGEILISFLNNNTYAESESRE